jgi:type 2 lantibiotic biosynthesis protein LanM
MDVIPSRSIRTALFGAVTLSERLAWLRATSSPRDGDGSRRESNGSWRDEAGFDEDQARRELATWRAQPPFDTGSWFTERLALDRIDEEELSRVLGESVELVESRAPDVPAWILALERAFRDPPRSFTETLALPAEFSTTPTAGFLDVVEPLVHAGALRMREGARALAARHPRPPFDPERSSELLGSTLPWKLHSMIMRAMVLELHGARMRGWLDGATSEDRFRQFTALLRRPGFALELLSGYPVLARALVRAVDDWVDVGLELLEHLARDADALRRTFTNGASLGALKAIESGAGDAHRGGRSVAIASFDSGLKLVYKPRSLCVDIHFQDLLGWVNARGDHPPFRTLAVLDCGDHGWMEFAAAGACASRAEVERFYFRQGGCLALLYVLEATDVHLENLIASGEHPVLVDLESLFHARVPEPPSGMPDLDLVTEATSSSVLRIGLLPRKTFGGEESAGIDLSALGAREGQLTPDRVLQWEGLGTDSMRARRVRLPMPGSQNRPELDGAELRVLHFQHEIARGFQHVYRLLARHRDELLSDGGPIARFADDEVRCVLRATRTYGLLLQESQHPDFQGDALDLERFFDRLWLGVEAAPCLRRAVRSEREDLLRGDVPMFTTRTQSRDLWNSRGERIEGFFEKSAMQFVRERMAGLGEEDLERQTWFVRASLASLTLELEELQWPSYRPVAPSTEPDPGELRAEMIAQARRIGDRLEELALAGGDDVAWIGLAFSNKQWELVPLLDDLYAGVSGVIHFLLYLWRTTGEPRYRELARAGLHTFRRRLASTRATMRSIGAFNGWGSVIYALAHWSALLEDEDLAREAADLCDLLPELIHADVDLDIVGGSAGLILALLALDALAPSELSMLLARQAGDKLVEKARRMDIGMGWFTRIETDVPITGFSHGAAGIAFALLELFRVTKDERYRSLALEAIRYEHTRFVPEQRNWSDPADPRESGAASSETEKVLSVAWCYGAPGIGLSRLKALDHCDDPLVREELDVAIQSTLDKGFGRNHSLCHGDLGNLDFLMQAARRLHDERLARSVRRISSAVLASMRRDGFLCGVPLGVESPALMNGLSGIGYGLLRLAEPESVPSVLSLDPPLRAAGRGA